MRQNNGGDTTVQSQRAFLGAFLLLLSLFGLAQAAGAQAQPRFEGKISARPDTFNQFMRKNIGRDVYLAVGFDKGPGGVLEPIGYRDARGRPFFEVKGYLYFIEGGGDGVSWAKTMKWNEANRRLSGTFRVVRSQKVTFNAGNTAISVDLRYIPGGKSAPLLSAARVQNGQVVATINGVERSVAKGAREVWVISDSALVYSGDDGSGGFENEGQSLTRYDANTGKKTRLMSEVYRINRVRIEQTRSGATALLVKMSDGGLGAPALAVVHPTRGEVWRMDVARLDGASNGRLTVASLAMRDVENLGDVTTEGLATLRPLKTLTLDLDELLARPVIHLKAGQF